MIAYASRTGTKRNLDALRAAGWHLLVSAAGVLRTEGFPYALDNGAWSSFQTGEPFVEKRFSVALSKLGASAEWVVLPDIVMGGAASLDLSLSWMDRVLGLAPRALLAVQNGMTADDVRPFLGPRVGIFVGGDSTWKEHTIGQWAALGRSVGCWVHVGRVNTVRRIAICTSEGVTSFDGTSASRFAKTVPMMNRARLQVGLFGGRAGKPHGAKEE